MLNRFERAALLSAVENICDLRGSEFTASILRPCGVDYVADMPDSALLAAHTQWAGVSAPARGVVAR
jgi:hypothetical protein